MTYGQENRAFTAKLGVLGDVFTKPTIVIELPSSQSHRADARAAFVLAANLLVRMFARVHLVAEDVAVEAHPWKIPSLHAAGKILSALSEGVVEWSVPPAADVVLGIGAPPSTAARHSVTIGFRPGVVTLDRGEQGGGEDVLAALIAACFGASQTFLHAAGAAGSALSPIDPFEFRLPSRADSDACDLGTVHLAGVGAIGCAVVYGFAHLPCRGRLVGVDADPVDTTNLHRYVLMKRDDVGSQKTAVAAAALAGTGVDFVPVVDSYQRHLGSLPNRHIDLLVTAVDSEAGRRHLAASLPKRIVNASTTDRYVTTSRHGFGDGKACLYCLYAPAGGPMTTEQRIAAELGTGVSEIERLIAENAPVDADFVRRVEVHRNAGAGAFAEWIGKPVQSFHQRAVCGTATIATPTGAVVAPLGFISAAAGLLLLADLIGGISLGDGTARPNYLRLDMLGSPEHADRDRRDPDPKRRCICSDEDYLDVYRARYGMTS